MALGLLVLRIVTGGLFAGLGAQKLSGSFGGHGLDGTGSFFESLGLRPGRMMALAAGLAELTGGALLALGLLTPLATGLVIAVMFTAIATVHWQNGVWGTNGGFEYNLVLATVAFALASIGAGRWSLDRVLGLHVAGWKWGVAALVLGVLGGLATAAARRLRIHGSTSARPASA
jgi:putative oxidoreductase